MELTKLLDRAKQNLEEDGALMPCLFLENTTKNELVIVGIAVNWNDHHAKHEMVWRFGQTIGFGYDIDRVTMATEAWVAVAPMEEGEDAKQARQKLPKSLADHVGSREAIIVIESTGPKTGAGSMTYFNKEVTLEGHTITFEDPIEMKGKMDSGLIDRFWEGKGEAEKAIEKVYNILNITPDHVFEDTGRTAREGAQVAARALALRQFGVEVYSG